jgi:hypothetical protein
MRGKMARKTDEERLQELQEKIKEMEVRKQQVEARVKEKERKKRTRRLIQVGAIFEEYFDIVGEDQAEKVAYVMKDIVEKNKEKIMNFDVKKAKKENKMVIYSSREGGLVIPEGEKNPYRP